MKKTYSIFLISLSVLNLMALTTPVHADENSSFDTGFDTGYDTGFDTGFDTDFDNTTTSKSESASGSSSAGSILAVGVGALLLSQVSKKGKSSGSSTVDASKGDPATNNGALNPTPAPTPKPTPAAKPTPSPSPAPTPNPLLIGPADLTPEMPAGAQAIPVLLAVGGVALYQRKKKSA